IVTFSDVSRWSKKAANALLTMGVRPGDPVLLMLKRRYEYWFVALGLMRLHCIQIPATHQLQKKDIVYRCNAADVRAVICVGEDEVLHHVRASLPESPTLTAIAALGGEHEGFLNFDEILRNASDEFDAAGISANSSDVMLMYFTSGTTGMPKMVAHDFTYPLGHLITGRFWHNLDDTSIHLTTADSGWAKCGWGKFYGQWIAGATHFIYDFDKFNAAKMLRMLEKYRVTSFCAPPTLYRFLIKENIASYNLSSLKWGTVAGEPLNPEVFQQFYKATGVKLREGFGQTETTPILLTPKWMEPKVGSMGKPSPHYTIRLLDDNGNDVEDGDEGEICIDLSNGHPAGLFIGYYRDAERTADAFAGGVYHTGDMAWRDEEGFYWFIGRADDVIKSSGYRIGPFEVESALIEHPAVLECAITGVPDPDRGQVVKATIMLAKGYEPSDALKKELQNHVKQATAPYKYPRIIEFVDELPKTFSGKIQRKKLREADKQAQGNK
ncbi:MAG: AMP-binding protein, partial [Rhodocyclaceae bacterium]|nr:AMP-binding protein [Rhodocyclaceae bacterium]